MRTKFGFCVKMAFQRHHIHTQHLHIVPRSAMRLVGYYGLSVVQ